MTDLQQHRDRLAFIRKSHWRQYESPSEHEDRAESCEITAARYFDHATTAQKAAYRAAVAGLTGFNSPREKRLREAINAAWYASTANARALFEATFDELMRNGEVSEQTCAAWDALAAPADLREVA